MPKRISPVAFLLGFAIGCFLIFDSLFIDIAVGIVLTLLFLLLPISILFGGKRGNDGRRRGGSSLNAPGSRHDWR